jgi:hypothetical protein
MMIKIKNEWFTFKTWLRCSNSTHPAPVPANDPCESDSAELLHHRSSPDILQTAR